ncbi:DUF1348 family protein [Winogradskyella sp. A3E31]|uniref:DUF1348 family protein n=1 Tax=Winogradskyella sp. A3E31 TaxID=3349637 RepID=UPI00398A9165
MKTKYVLVICFFLCLINCKNNPKSSSERSIESDNTISEVEKTYYDFGMAYTDAWNSKKPNLVAYFFSETGTLTVNNNNPLIGRAQIAEFANGFMTAFPDMKLTMDSLVVKSNATEYHWRFKGTNTGPGGTGNTVDFSGFERWIFDENGKIQQSMGSFDEEEYERQVIGDTLN